MRSYHLKKKETIFQTLILRQPGQLFFYFLALLPGCFGPPGAFLLPLDITNNRELEVIRGE